MGRPVLLAQPLRYPLAHDIIGLYGGEPRDVRIGVVVGEHDHVEPAVFSYES